MFSGIIIATSKLQSLKKGVLKLKVPKAFYAQVKVSDSVAVDGICLTLTKKKNNILQFDVMPETVKKTNLGNKNPDDKLNLELPLTLQKELGGHFVQGHVDGVGTVKKIQKKGNSYIFTISAPKKLMPYIADKGSIALNGISLTVIKALKDGFTTGIIPFTWQETNLHQAKVGTKVNLETDIIAKYVSRAARLRY